MSPAVPRASAPHRACPACQTTPPTPRAAAIAGASPARATASSSTAVDPAAEAPTTTAARRTLTTLTPRRRWSAQAVPALPSVLLVVRSDEGYGLTLFSHITFGAILFTQQKVQILNAETNVTSNILLLLFNTLFLFHLGWSWVNHFGTSPAFGACHYNHAARREVCFGRWVSGRSGLDK